MNQYLDIVDTIKFYGHRKGDRTKTGTTSFFGQQKRFALHHNFKPKLPTVTTKYIHLTAIEHELLWMLSGDTRLEYLIANGVRIWNEWVLPGTEVWAPMTQLEIEKYLNDNWDTEVTIVGGSIPYTLDLTDGQPKKFMVSAEAYRKATTVTDAELIATSRTDYLHYEHLKRLYRVVTGKEPQKLVGGALGPVYGKTWRNIEDVRIIDKGEWADYEARGFTFVVDIPGPVFTEDRCVVKRKIDQIQNILDDLSKEPEEDFSGKGNNVDSRRLIVCAWDPRLVEDQALPPCHTLFQFFTRKLTLQERLDAYRASDELRQIEDRKNGIIERGGLIPSTVDQFIKSIALWKNENDPEITEEVLSKRLDENNVPTRAISCQLYQRSGDTFLGVPFNITFYSLLTHMLANQFNMVAEEFIWTGGDTHIYSNHEEQTDLQLKRDPLEIPSIRFHNKGQNILTITRDDYTIENYKSHARINGKVAV